MRQPGARLGANDPAATEPRPLRVDDLDLAEAADDAELRFVQLAFEGCRAEEAQPLARPDAHQRRGSDDLAATDLGLEAEIGEGLVVLVGQPVDRAMQGAKALFLVPADGSAAAAENFAERAGREDQRVIERFEMSGDQAVGLVVGRGKRRQGDRIP